MGKRRLEELTAEFGPNTENLNPHSDQGMLQLKKEQSKHAKMNHARTVVWRRFKKVYSQFNKTEVIANEKKRLAVVAKIGYPFGGWGIWIDEGKIGPDDEEDQRKARCL